MSTALLLFRDKAEIEPPAEQYKKRDEDEDDENIYDHVAPAKFIACPEDIWAPVKDAGDNDVADEVKEPTPWQIFLKNFQKKTISFLDHNACLLLVFIGTFWALFAEDMAYGVPLPKDVDEPIAVVTLCFLIFFCLEQLARSVVERDNYLFTFFWWMELVRWKRPKPARMMDEFQPSAQCVPSPTCVCWNASCAGR